MVEAEIEKLKEETMSINVKTENVNDATVQVHIAFENASRRRGYPRRRRATRTFNRARLRTADSFQINTGRNIADHRSSTKARLRSEPRAVELLPPVSVSGPRSRRLA